MRVLQKKIREEEQYEKTNFSSGFWYSFSAAVGMSGSGGWTAAERDGLITEKFGEGALLLWIAVEPFYVYHRK